MHSTPELILTTLAGLGLFFVGLHLLQQHLQQLAGRRLRRVAGTLSSKWWTAAVSGCVIGFLTQSGRTASFLLAGLVQGGVLTLQRALPLVLWANCGCTLIVFAAILPFDLLVLAALGIFGTAYAFNIPKSYTPLSGTLFAVALLLFGLGLISDAASHLLHYPVAQPLLDWINASALAGFAAAVLLTLLVQSHLAVVLIALTMVGSGVLAAEQAMAVILGSQVGSAGITLLLSLHLKGDARRLVSGQILYNFCGLLLFAPLLILSVNGGESLALAGLQLLTADAALQAGLFAILFNTLSPALLTAVHGSYQRVLERLHPRRDSDDLLVPKYIAADLDHATETALILLEREHLRLLSRLPHYLIEFRDEVPAATPCAPVADLHQAHQLIATQIENGLTELVSRQLDIVAVEETINLQHRTSLLNTLEEALHRLHSLLRAAPAGAEVCHKLSHQLIESLDTQLLTAVAAVEQADALEAQWLFDMTADKGPALQSIRRHYLERIEESDQTQRARILDLTTAFERAAWALHRYAENLLHATRKVANSTKPNDTEP